MHYKPQKYQIFTENKGKQLFKQDLISTFVTRPKLKEQLNIKCPTIHIFYVSKFNITTIQVISIAFAELSHNIFDVS
jgi:hypothetical protein